MQTYPYQQECLDAIEAARQAGRKKALVVMATGLGKTVISALQLKHIIAEDPGRILYLAHQTEILKQARRTYESILDPETTYGYFHGQEKHLHRVDALFATFQTMAGKRELFDPDEFKYIIVDEAHHVHADTFRPTVEYFQPDFMIGLTATPDRGDEKDIRQLMGEPVFHLNLFEALANKYLTPIEYRLMTDELQNLEALDTPAGKLSVAELNRTIFVPKRDEEIVRIIEEKLDEVTNPRVIIFCSSVAHAEQIGELMPYAPVLHSGIRDKDQRKRRIEAFRKGYARAVITVNMFNEGIDIPEANVVVFLRSTESRTIYLQQLGRGLRRAEGKDKVLVLDFVANCEQIELIDYVQSGVAAAAKESVEATPSEGEVNAEPILREVFKLTIEGVEFNERLIDLVNVVGRARQNYTKEELREQLLAFAKELGRAPYYKEVNANPAMATRETYERVFAKTWNALIKEVGLTPNRDYSYTKESLIQQLLTFAEELGRTPSVDEVRKAPALANPSTYMRAFNTTWHGVLSEAGLKPQKNQMRYTKEELKRQLLDYSAKLGRAPKSTEVERNPQLASIMTFMTAFDKGWGEILEEVGLTPHRQRYTKEELTRLLLNYAAELGRAPAKSDVANHPRMPSVNTYIRQFNMSWSDILQVVGLTPNPQKNSHQVSKTTED